MQWLGKVVKAQDGQLVEARAHGTVQVLYPLPAATVVQRGMVLKRRPRSLKGHALPRLRVFAGPNGSGKSTIRELLRKEWIGVYMNTVEKLPRRDRGHRSG